MSRKLFPLAIIATLLLGFHSESNAANPGPGYYFSASKGSYGNVFGPYTAANATLLVSSAKAQGYCVYGPVYSTNGQLPSNNCSVSQTPQPPQRQLWYRYYAYERYPNRDRYGRIVSWTGLQYAGRFENPSQPLVNNNRANWLATDPYKTNSGRDPYSRYATTVEGFYQ